MINILRHVEIFSPNVIEKKRIDVIGCGATGSKVICALAKLGIEEFHVWDFDRVEEHNIANQEFSPEHIGQLKAEAIADVVRHTADARVISHCEKLDGTQALGDIVFLLTDTMESRKKIWEGSLKSKMYTDIMIETRMGPDSGRIYALNPSIPSHIRGWEATLYSDSESQTSACGSQTIVGVTADIISGLAVWQFIRYTQIYLMGKTEDTLENEVIFSVRPLVVTGRVFSV